MKKQLRRWYEQNEHIKAFMGLMQDLDLDSQCEIAVDMIVKASSYIDRDYSKLIQEVSSFNQNDYNRWYDINPNVHLAIESLKDLTEEKRIEIIEEFSDRILNNHPENVEEVN